MEQSKHTYKSMAKREIAQPVSYLVNSSVRVLRARRRLQQETPVKEEVQQQPMSEQERFLSMFGLCRVSPSILPPSPAEPEKQIHSPADVKEAMCESNQSSIATTSDKMDIDEDNTPVLTILPTPDLKEDGSAGSKPLPKDESSNQTDSNVANNESMIETEDIDARTTNNESIVDVLENDRLIIIEFIDLKEENTPTTENKAMKGEIAPPSESIEAAIDAKEEENSPVDENVTKNPVEDKTLVLNIGGKETTLEYHPEMARFYHSKVRTPEEQAKRDKNNEACRKSRARAKAGLTRKYVSKKILVINEE